MKAEREALLAAARVFRDDDPDPVTRAEAGALIQRAGAAEGGEAWIELEERFGAELTFGTAGLRGLIGAGSNRMNRRVVARTTAGLCAYLLRQYPDAQKRGICLGYDGRHQSRAFADEVASVAQGAGFVVHRFDEVVPTPLVAFAVLDSAAVSGIVITASHNPAKYNGYKVYLEDGAQLGSPADREVELERAKIGSVLALPRLAWAEAQAAGLAPSVSGVSERYVARVAAAVGRGARVGGTRDSGGSGAVVEEHSHAGAANAGVPPALPLRAAYTALHGVGEPLARRVFAAIGATDVHSVPEQAAPDPDFPTVAFPNPEEPGALDLVLALGERIGADLAIANDPDADRLALAARLKGAGLAALSGNEVGVLLADHLLALAPRDGGNFVVSTIVSTPLLDRVVRDHGAQCIRTLTGFKWIVGKALQVTRERGSRFVLGFEEALGYCIGDITRDKDGIAAAAHALHMAELHARAGRTLHDALELLYRRHGLCHSTQISFTRPGTTGLAEIRNAMAKLRANPPRDLAGLSVVGSVDLAKSPEARPALPPGILFDASELPPSDVVAFQLEGEHRITVRPSGTEPKLKLYLDVWVKLENSPELGTARRQAQELSARLAAATATQLGF
ncbi:MAG TPA: phospho-sugar mutase [Polyangiales bacterium]|nr:phospho-sugar mutase [Polyangiales bacterium]